ncbi:PepSY-like domain-containing protein [Methylocaldum sp.]|uniref:PepSY-like domain-containing protein n=1 Tax=Methylocaldum sp. TaxID=1969727 RepID=UPI002D6D1DF2|nr:PepSY-like domain-containing protein [Methylocaldum sp.]HYE33893.1 PepSY-like domain-containing protein [Methylocaldum sp.]
MNKHLFIAAIVGVAIVDFSPVAAHEPLLSKQDIPQAVLAAFQKDHPTAKRVKYEEETIDGKNAYEIAFQDEKAQERSEVYSADGTLMETEKVIKINELPEAVLQAVKDTHPRATLQRAFQVSNTSGTVTSYEVEIREGKREREVEFDTNGKILSRC